MISICSRFQEALQSQSNAQGRLQIDPSKAGDMLKSTGSTIFYRNTGRQTKPAWGNRIVKDFYDLDYEVGSQLSKLTQNFKNSDTKRIARARRDIKQTKLARKKMLIQKTANMLSSRRKTEEQRIDSPKNKRKYRHNPQTIEIGQLVSSSSKYQGLCPFEFENTIQGRMQKRLNHHLSFQKNSIKRITNEHSIYYDKHKQINFSHKQMIEERRKLKKYHPFSSYSERRVFQPKNELDKVFQTDKARNATTFRRSPQKIIDFDKILERRQAKLGESKTLTYDVMPSALKIKKKGISYSIQRSQRSTSFSPEVILDKRGCRR